MDVPPSLDICNHVLETKKKVRAPQKTVKSFIPSFTASLGSQHHDNMQMSCARV